MMVNWYINTKFVVFIHISRLETSIAKIDTY